MFTGDKWKNSHFANTRDASSIEDVVLYKECLTGAFPIMQVLIMVDSYAKPAIGFIYKGLDQVEEKIQKEFNDDEKGNFTNLQIEI